MTKRLDRGFSLIELLIVITIVAVLVFIASPRMDTFSRKNNIENIQKQFEAAILMARAGAANYNTVASVCSSNDAQDCNDSEDWSSGWIVFLDDGSGGGSAANGIRDGAEPLELVYENKAQARFSVTFKDEDDKKLTVASFNNQGFSLIDGRAYVSVCDRDESTFGRGLVVERSGRTMLSRDLDDDGVHEVQFENGQGAGNKLKDLCK